MCWDTITLTGTYRGTFSSLVCVIILLISLLIQNFCMACANAYSDSLVVEVSGGEAAAKLYKQSDEKGFQAFEVGYASFVTIVQKLFSLNW